MPICPRLRPFAIPSPPPHPFRASQYVYEFLLRFVVSNETDPKVVKKYIDTQARPDFAFLPFPSVLNLIHTRRAAPLIRTRHAHPAGARGKAVPSGCWPRVHPPRSTSKPTARSTVSCRQSSSLPLAAL
eukprot:6174843-Pleurochrysis_carterae.AAC.1